MDVTDEDAVEAGVENAVKDLGSVDILVSNAGIQIVNPIENFSYADWKKLMAIHLDGAFLTTRACLKRMYAAGKRRLDHLHGFGAFQGSVEAQSAICRGETRADRPGQSRRQRRRGAQRARECDLSRVSCARRWSKNRFRNKPRNFGISEDDVVKKIMLKDTVDGEFTTVDDVAACALFFAGFESNALTGQSIVVSHGWFMQ